MNKIRKPSTQKIFFIKSLIKYALLLLLPLGIVGFYSLYRFNKETNQTIEARNWNLMYQIQTEADSIFHTVDIISTYLTSNSSLTKTIQELFLHDKFHSDSLITKNTLVQYFQSVLASNEYTYLANLYYENDLGKVVEASGNFSYMRIYPEINLLDNYLHSDTDFGIEHRQINTGISSRKKEVITVYKKLYSTHSNDLPKGLLLINFSTDRIKDYISHFDLYPGQIILFIKETEAPLLQSAQGDFSGIWEQIAQNLNTTDDYSVFRTTYNDVIYLTSIIPSSTDGLFYISLIPTQSLYEETHTLTIVFGLVVAAACVISILLSAVNTRHEYLQLKSIIDVFHDVDNDFANHKSVPLKHDNPYQIILHNVINMFLEQRYLKLQVENKQYQLQLLELRSLQHQINPHFLFNTLNTIYWEAIHLNNRPNTCSSMISDLSDIMAYSLSDGQNKVQLAKELEFLEHYTNIQKVRYNHSFDVILDIDDEAMDMAVIKMLLQPLVENAISHGINKKEGHGIIKIKVYYRSSNILFHILDNGIGIPTDKLTILKNQLQSPDTGLPPNHIGLINTNRRLRLSYGEASAIHLYSRYHIGTVISFSIPAEKFEP